MIIRPFEPEDRVPVVALWQRCNLVSPTNDPNKDIDRKLKIRPDLFLVAVVDRKIVGSVMVGYEGHRGWINYLGVDPEHRRAGVGRALMAEAERLLRREGCPKINLQVRTSNLEVLAFYRALGYKQDDVVSLGFRLEQDRAP